MWAYVRQVSGLALRRHSGLRLSSGMTWISNRSRWPARVAWEGSAECASGSRRPFSSGQEYIVNSHIPDIPLPSGYNAAAYVMETAKLWPTNTALECAITGRKYTYAQVVDLVAKWGGFLSRLGLRKGDMMAIMMLNCPEYPLVMLGAMNVGVSVTVINSGYTAREVCRQLEDSDACLVVSDDATEKVVNDALSLLQKPLRKVINTDTTPPSGVPSLRGVFQDASMILADIVEVNERDTILLPYSSGTTGKPKGVEMSHKAISSNLAMMNNRNFSSIKPATDSHQTTVLCYLPLFHVYGINLISFCALCSGAKIVYMPCFDRKIFVSQIVKHKVQMLHTVPPVLNFMVQSPDVNSKTMASVDTIMCGAASVPHSSVEFLKKKIDKSFFYQEVYGMTEVLVSHLSPLGSSTYGTCGKLLPNVKCKVIDCETGKSLPPNEKGEICFMSPSRMTGYINNEAATRATIDSDGWLHSGDIGFYDENNFFSIVDRVKDLIKVKAMQVSPSEIEEILLEHPKVKEAGVIGVPNDRLGEAPRAYIVTSSPLSEREIQEFVGSRLAPQKQLAGGVFFISELPKTASGKILRRQLREL